MNLNGQQLRHWGARCVRGDENASFAGVTADSRRVGDGFLFVAVRGHETDGLAHQADALRRGARGIVVDEGRQQMVDASVAAVFVTDRVRELLADAVRHVHDYPDRRLELIAVTGTNGKTTVSHLLRDLHRESGRKFGLLGTIRYDTGAGDQPAPLTTPGVERFFELLAEMAERSLDGCVFEASSHALDQMRIGACEVDFAVFLNLEREHLDYHQSLERYRDAKAKLLQNLDSPSREKPVGCAVINGDVAAFAGLKGPGRTLRFGEGASVEHRRYGAICDGEGVRFGVNFDGEEATVRAPLLGGYNVENLHAAVAAMSARGMQLSEVARLAERVRPVTGRMEPLRLPGGPLCILDYAHTAEGIAAALAATRDLAAGRIAIVFGCGGDRDRGKRPGMARAAIEAADLAVLTLDNPRTEDPAQIFADARAGFAGASHPERGIVIEDRAAALRHALDWATPDDVVLVTGKGHERYQIIGRDRLPWDDGEELRSAWKAMEAGA